MKALLKTCLLFALIIGGKLAKPTPPPTVAAKQVAAPAANEIVMVHQVLTSEPVPASPDFDFEAPRKRDSSAISSF